MLYIQNKDGLIGDFLGSIPAMQALGKTDKLVVEIHPEAEKLVSLIDNPDEIVFTTQPSGGHIAHTIYSATAFPIATGNNWYMSQAFFRQVGLEVPLVPPKAKLKYDDVNVPTFDYIISPFARSLPDRQKVTKSIWKELVDLMPDKTFCVIGTSVHDRSDFILRPNVWAMFDCNFEAVCNLLIKARYGLISVVTGTSHLAFHLGVKNWILNNQDFKWGTNPDGYSLRHDIPSLFGYIIKDFLESSE